MNCGVCGVQIIITGIPIDHHTDAIKMEIERRRKNNNTRIKLNKLNNELNNTVQCNLYFAIFKTIFFCLPPLSGELRSKSTPFVAARLNSSRIQFNSMGSKLCSSANACEQNRSAQLFYSTLLVIGHERECVIRNVHTKRHYSVGAHRCLLFACQRNRDSYWWITRAERQTEQRNADPIYILYIYVKYTRTHTFRFHST